MPELQSPQPGTREYYAQRETTDNPRRSELLLRLNQKVWREVALQIPKNERPTEEELSDVGKLVKNKAFCESLWTGKYPYSETRRLYERVRGNIGSKQGEDLQGDVSESPAFRLLGTIVDRLDDLPVPIETLQEYGNDEIHYRREFAKGFVSNMMEAFLQRKALPKTNIDGGIYPNISLEQLYVILNCIAKGLSNMDIRQQRELIDKLCYGLPEFSGAELSWHRIGDIGDLIRNEIGSKRN